VRILVVNAGSSSTKLRVVDGDATVAREDLPAIEANAKTTESLRTAVLGLGPVDAVGHRVVHGGTEYRKATVVDDIVVERLAALADLAPLHQPAALAALRAARAVLRDQPHVACFDTAFHATIPAAAATYALPPDWRERWPIRRFGFHGLSHAYAARRGAELLARPLAELRLVTAHLGAGASLTAVMGGRSVDTTMGFTPLEGLVMATRSGSVDPGLLLWLQRTAGVDVDALAEGLEHRSGLLGLGGTADMRELLTAADDGSAGAALARDVYVHRLRAGIAAMAASMNGVDALVFTGGVGENAAPIRAWTVDGLGFLGLDVDAEANERGVGDRVISSAASVADVVVVASREELEIARQVRSLLASSTRCSARERRPARRTPVTRRGRARSSRS
jgi:acetate kinase